MIVITSLALQGVEKGLNLAPTPRALPGHPPLPALVQTAP